MLIEIREKDTIETNVCPDCEQLEDALTLGL